MNRNAVRLLRSFAKHLYRKGLFNVDVQNAFSSFENELLQQPREVHFIDLTLDHTIVSRFRQFAEKQDIVISNIVIEHMSKYMESNVLLVDMTTEQEFMRSLREHIVSNVALSKDESACMDLFIEIELGCGENINEKVDDDEMMLVED